MVCMRMGLENVADSIALLRDECQKLIGRLGAQLAGCGIVIEDRVYDYGLVGCRVCSYVLPGTCFRFEYAVYMWLRHCDGSLLSFWLDFVAFVMDVSIHSFLSEITSQR
jgi:hypothetical protein